MIIFSFKAGGGFCTQNCCVLRTRMSTSIWSCLKLQEKYMNYGKLKGRKKLNISGLIKVSIFLNFCLCSLNERLMYQTNIE